ncbi:MAG: aminotransferase class I/II-fold pyridoxal phosphate-dependent enzyme, partial [Planctomycetota bacterium]
CRYGPSAGMAEFRQAAADYLNDQYGYQVTAANVIAGPGAKNFQQLFLEAFVNPDDGVLVFSPHFPTYSPNIARRGARMVLATLREDRRFRPDPRDVQAFVDSDPSPKAVLLNTPHNPTGGVATGKDLEAIAEIIAPHDVAVFSDEPYDTMVWSGEHATPATLPGMLARCVAAYTFSKSFSMSGWRLGFAVSSEPVIEMLAKLTNTALSCVPPFIQAAGAAALREDLVERDRRMLEFRDRVQRLVDALDQIDGIACKMPMGSFYAFANVMEACNRLGISSHGLAMYLLEAADDSVGVACLGGECFGSAGAGFLRFSVAEPTERLLQATDFLNSSLRTCDRLSDFLADQPKYRLDHRYEVAR